MDYLASTRTREEILNDPLLCHFLQNPYLKDNMELALKFKEAKRGGYNEKREFLEHFFCNGPELEPDTILYYRDKCNQDPVYLEIAEIEFSNFELVDTIRASKYGKDSSEGNCFTKPCNYLGPLSKSIGMIGDSNNFLTLSNIFAKNKKKVKDAKGKEVEIEESVWGNIRQHMVQMMLPDLQVGCQVLYNNMKHHMQSFLNDCERAGITDHISLGDPVSIDRSELLSSATKINTVNRLGDCARLWQHMRQFNPYDPKKNTKGPIEDHMKVDNKETDGSAKDHTAPTSPVKYATPTSISAAAAKGNKTAEATKELSLPKYTLTIGDVNYLLNNDASEEDKIKFTDKIYTDPRTLIGDGSNYDTAQRKEDKFWGKIEKEYFATHKCVLASRGGSEPTEGEKTSTKDEAEKAKQKQEEPKPIIEWTQLT